MLRSQLLHSKRNLVIGYYPDDETAAGVFRRLSGEGFFRSAMVSVSDQGRRSVRNHPLVLLLFAALLTFLFWAASYFAGTVSLGYTPAIAAVVFAAGFLLGPFVGLTLPKSVIREYASRVFPGEAMVLVQCRPADTRRVSELLHGAERAKPALFVIRPYLREPWTGTRRERELLSTDQLRKYAIARAAAQTALPPSKTRISILHQLSRWEEMIVQARRDLTEAVQLEQSITPSAEWLLDNSYIIQNHIQDIRRNLPRKYHKLLPRLEGRPGEINVRVLRLAEDLVEKTDGSITPGSIYNFLIAYQGARPLTTAELWIFPLMLRYALIEDLAYQSIRVSRRQHDRERADFWANRLLSAAHRSPERIPLIFNDIAASLPSLRPHFLIRLIGQLSEEETVFSAAQKWIEEQLKMPLQETVRVEHARQTRKQFAVANDVTTLRRLTQIDWREIFESVSLVEAVLEQDAVYAASAFATRDQCRRAVEEIARYSEYSEIEVARRAVQQSLGAREERSRTVAYHLIGRGRPAFEAAFNCRLPLRSRSLRWLRSHAGPVYFGAVAAVLTAVMAAGLFAAATSGAGIWMLLAFAVSAVWPASEVAIQIVNYMFGCIIPPSLLPRMSFKSGIPEEFKTLVVVPTMLLTPDSVKDEVDRLEVRYLANREANLFFALLTDFSDAPQQHMAEDRELFEIVLNGIAELNARYPDSPFFLFHREREWCETERCWAGWERKRGKLEDLNRFLNGQPREGLAGFLKAGNPMHLKDLRYIITLDADTELPPDAALHMIETMAHPLNHPVIDAERRVVSEGYGIIQPRVVTSLPAASASVFTRLFADARGTDPYAQAISDLYQDLFGEGIFIGKGIYDLRAFHQVLSGRFPEQKLLSHDLIESNYLRAGFDSTILLFENFPSNYSSYSHRQHRWIRGDWQIMEWLLPRVPDGDGHRERNPISAVGRWKIFDNLRRSLIAPVSLLVLAASWLSLPTPLYWNIFIALALLIPALVPIPSRLRAGFKGQLFVWRQQWTELMRALVTIALLPHQSWNTMDAIVRVWHRLKSGHFLLQWETSQSVRRRFDGNSGVPRGAYLVSLATAALIVGLYFRGFSVWAAAFPYLALWFFSPVILRWVNLPKRREKERDLNEEERLYLRRIARETWRFFDDLVGPEGNWLPPDNSQESIRVEVAYRTSPTNIGLWLLSALAAHDSGYLTVDDLVARLSESFKTIDRLEKYRGHLLNWYDIRTLEPLRPRYVSTVDSGNLMASLWTLDQGLQELISKPVICADELRGVADTVSVLRVLYQAGPSADSSVARQIAELAETCGTAVPALRALQEQLLAAAAAAGKLIPALRSEKLSSSKGEKLAREISYWCEKLDEGVRSRVALLNQYFGWVSPLLDVPKEMRGSAELKQLTERLLEGVPLSLQELAGEVESPLGRLEQALAEVPGAPDWWIDKIRLQTERARQAASEQLRRIRWIVEKSGALQAGMDFKFLYDKDRKLFLIGYDLGEAPQSSSCYDLLASEARLTSLIAIARGEIEPEHWQAMSRPFGLFAGRKVLYSWSGSMFEYLMPVLFTRTFDNSLLHHACQEAVAAHIDYGKSHHVPWGISESAFSELDSHQIYQYRAFGIPALGLKRGLADDLVVAPYATALALMVAPVRAVENFKALESAGLHGPRGFYEAIDYSRESREGTRGAIVHAYMAHHQGMSFLAINNALYSGRMQQRFHSDLRVRAAESLLYEGIPPSKIASYLNTTEERPPARLIAMPAEAVATRSGNEKTQIPKTQLLSNGSYSLMITNSGGGYSRWREYDLSRWRADTTRDHWGTYCYIRDLDNGDFWSATYHPTDREDSDYSVTYYSERVEFRQRREGIESVMDVTVSPEDDVEVRRIVLINRTAERKRIDLTTYSELVLAPHAADRAHPAFNKLFVQTEILPDRSAIIAFRQSGAEESRVWVGHHLASAPGLKTQFESCRGDFVGRGRSLAAPSAMSRNLSNTSGPVLDPIASIRKEVMLEPGEKARFALISAAADSRDGVINLIDRYRDLEAADRAFELAWTHTQLTFRYLRIQHEDAQRFQELAARLIYPNALLRPGSERLRRNVLGQSRLWAFGISGDLPICAVVVSDPLDLGTVREVLQAHSFWHERGFRSDLVILNTEAGGYEMPLQQKLIKMIQIYSVNTGTDKPGGVFLRSLDKLSGEDFTLILSAAHVVLLASRGSLGRQLSSQPEAPSYPPALKPFLSAPEDPVRLLPLPELTYFNGIGGFSADGKEYVTYLDVDGASPAPWINVLANPEFGCIVDETGQGTAWHLNSQLNRLTPWLNDPVEFDSSSALYIRDEDTGAFWSSAAAPLREDSPYRVYHGQGYTRIEHNSHGIEHELVIFVPVDDDGGHPVRIQRLQLRNRTSRKRRLTVTFYAEWVLGRDREETQLHVFSSWDPVSRALIARNAYNSEFSGQIAFAAAIPSVETYTADRTEFLGRNGSAANPAAMGRQFLSGRTGAALDPCAALQVRIEIEPGEQTEVSFLLGQADNMQQARSVIGEFSEQAKVRQSLAATRQWWDRLLGTIQVSTPEEPADFLLNRWLLYQTLSCRIWGRSALYQSGGAFGFRDQLQDVMAIVYVKPEIARQQILRSAGRQFLEGDVQHWWHPQSGAGVRTRCSDDLLWLPYVVAHYVRVTGDAAILEERIPFLEAQPLADHEMEVYATPSLSMTDGTLFEHCQRAIEKGLTAGPHGLPLIGLCDWNDGFNRVGVEGKGESVWLAWFLIEVLRGFRYLCSLTGRNSDAQACDTRIERLESAVEFNGWDGEWYRRAYFDDGSPLGSHLSRECRIDSLAQSWAVISGGAPEDRADKALQAVEEHLIRDKDRLVLLFTPPFQRSERNPGYVQSYPPGVRENGGQYTHAAAWVAMALARQGNGKRAVEVLRMLNPIELTRSPSGILRYKCEPYVLAGDVYSLEGRVGQGGWTWYTGSSAWMYRVWLEEVLGFKLRGGTLMVDPVIPAQWPGFSIRYVYGNSVYRIEVDNPERTGRGVAWIELDGTRLQAGPIPLVDDGRAHEVRIQLGRLRNAVSY